MNREYYKDINYNPYLFYVVFGVSVEQLQVSRKKHYVDELPAGLDMRMLNRQEHVEQTRACCIHGVWLNLADQISVLKMLKNQIFMIMSRKSIR